MHARMSRPSGNDEPSCGPWPGLACGSFRLCGYLSWERQQLTFSSWGSSHRPHPLATRGIYISAYFICPGTFGLAWRSNMRPEFDITWGDGGPSQRPPYLRTRTTGRGCPAANRYSAHVSGHGFTSCGSQRTVLALITGMVNVVWQILLLHSIILRICLCASVVI